MKRIKYIMLRRLTFSVYLLMTIGFCLLLYHMGEEEIEKAELYADKEKKYVSLLLSCRGTLDSTENAFAILQADTSPQNINLFLDATASLRKSANQLTNQEKNRTSREFMPESKLKNHAAALFSVSRALLEDIDAPVSESPILIRENMEEIAGRLSFIREELHDRLKVELNHVENWQNQSLFFFEKLEVHLVFFFILTTIFTAAAFMLSGYVLRRYLGFLSAGAHEISSGKLNYRFNDETEDVIGEVMRDFDFMAQKLQEQTRDLQKINTELNRKAAELQAANEHKDRFLANMSHELRTPLNSIIGFSDLIIAKSKDYSAEKAKSHAQKILNAAEHLLELISDLLEIAKVGAGVIKMEPADFDLNEMARAVFEMLQPIASRKELDFTVELKNESTPINADRRLIRQAMINIINNALKFTKAGSVKIIVSSNRKNNIIEVVDTGIGISREEQQHIFKDFHRVEQGLTSNYEGVGLGLTLTKRIIELHKGTIKVKSKIGQGSIFTVNLPR